MYKRQVLAFVLCLLMAYCAEEFFGVADITGAYVAGLVISCTPKSSYIQSKFEPLSFLLLTPVFFASVGINSFSYIKKDISAVICDRLHPDGTTLRNGKALEWYSQFYDARDIIDLDVRPDRGVKWTPKSGA